MKADVHQKRHENVPYYNMSLFGCSVNNQPTNVSD